MTKTQVAVTVGVIVGLGTPIAIQQGALTEIRAANQATTIQSGREPDSSARDEAYAGLSENEERERLRRLAEDIRAQLAAKSAAPPDPADGLLPVAPVLLSVGKAVSVFDLSYAGTATPEATLQSLLALVREADLHGIVAVTAFPPTKVERINEALASEETRRMLSEQMQKGLFGLLVSESVEQHEDGSTSHPVVKEVWPDNPLGQVSVEILKTEQIDERRVGISAKLTRGTESKVEKYTFGKTKGGWRHLWQ